MEQVAALVALQNQPQNHNQYDSDDYVKEAQRCRRRFLVHEDDNQCWKIGMRIEVPEFHRNL